MLLFLKQRGSQVQVCNQFRLLLSKRLVLRLKASDALRLEFRLFGKRLHLLSLLGNLLFESHISALHLTVDGIEIRVVLLDCILQLFHKHL